MDVLIVGAGASGAVAAVRLAEAGSASWCSESSATRASGVAELWLVDINRDVVVVCQDPVDDTYQRVQVVQRGESIALEVASGALVSVQSILG